MVGFKFFKLHNSFQNMSLQIDQILCTSISATQTEPWVSGNFQELYMILQYLLNLPQRFQTFSRRRCHLRNVWWILWEKYIEDVNIQCIYHFLVSIANRDFPDKTNTHTQNPKVNTPQHDARTLGKVPYVGLMCTEEEVHISTYTFVHT